MVRMMRNSIFVIMILLLSYGAYAFEYSYNASLDTILPGGVAKYEFHVINNQERSDQMQLYTVSPYWDLSPTLITIPAGGTIDFTLEIAPLSDTIFGPQLVPVTIKFLREDIPYIENLYVYVKSTSAPLHYVPNIAMEVRIKDEIDAREPLSLDVNMRNRNPLNLEDLRIQVESELFTKEFKTSLNGLEEKTNTVLFTEINALQPPGLYKIRVKLYALNKTISEVVKEVRVKEYADVSVEHTLVKTLFSSTDKIALYNNGNSPAVKNVLVEKSWFARIFTTASTPYTVTTGDGPSAMSWNIPLEPQQRYELTVRTNYTILVVIIFLIIVAILCYFIFRSPVLLYKNAKIITDTEEGVSAVKIHLHVKNRSGKTIRNIRILDKYPKIVKFEEDTAMGTLRPTKLVGSDKTHSTLMWTLDVLDPYEERLVSYKVKSTLNIVGNITLPAGKVKFSAGTGDRTYYSNEVKLIHKSHHAMDEK